MVRLHQRLAVTAGRATVVARTKTDNKLEYFKL